MSDWLPILRRTGVSVLFQSYINQGYQDSYYQELLGVPVGLGSHRYVHGWVIIHGPEADAFASHFLPRLHDPAYVAYFLRKCSHLADTLLTVGRELSARDHHPTDRAVILFDFMRFSSHSIRMMPFLNTMVFVQDELESRLRESLGSYFGLAADDPELSARLQDFMAQGTQMPMASRAMEELGRIARAVTDCYPRLAEQLRVDPRSLNFADVQTSAPNVAARAAAYLDAYDFLTTNYYVGAPTTWPDFCEQLGGFMSRQHQAATAQRVEADMTDLPEADRALIEVAQELQYLREYRLEALYKSGRDARGLLLAICVVLGTSYSELLSLTFHEIQQALTAKIPVDLSVVHGRMRGYASTVHQGTTAIVVGEEIVALGEDLPVAGSHVDSLFGVTAYPGDFTGPIRIVTELADVDAVRAGDVLAAPMTMPYHVPAMARAGAVITDEGGILSHAAIVARELRIPCIVGLNTVTTAFEDGDTVRVHAAPVGGVVERAGL